MTEYAKKLLRLYHEQSKKNRIIEGSLPLNFKGKGKDLKNYRIYGNTVNGESVGDRTGNLFDGEIEQGTISADGILRDVSNIVRAKNFTVLDAGTYTIQSSNNVGEISVFIFTYTVDGTFIERLPSDWIALPYSFTLSERAKVKIVFEYTRGEAINPTDVKNIMLNSGSEPLPYEPYGYRVPVSVTNGTDTVTTNLYLPEQIKMVGDEAEYVDYGAQKMHRVRKNLFQTIATSQTINDITFTVNANGSVTCNGTNHGNDTIIFEFNYTGVVLPEGVYITSGCPAGGSQTGGYKIQYYNGSGWNYELGSGNTFTLSGSLNYRSRILIAKNVTVTNLTFYPMIRLATIDDDTYEPYIENTDLDVTLPALPTLSGTNTLSVGTEVQPSKVEIKGKIKAVQEGSGENEGE